MPVDYNAIASQYAAHRRLHPGVLQNLLETCQLGPSQSALEVGCGTGNYILVIQAVSRCQGWGVDPAEKMLEIARQRSQSVTFQIGAANQLPFPGESFDLVFSVDMVHHLQQKHSYIQQAHRLLKIGGKLCTVTENEILLRTRVPLARYFPETIEKELLRYPRDGELQVTMRSAGFENLQEVVVRHPYQIRDLQPFEDKAFSVLHLISEQAWQQGLARMRADLAQAPIQAVSHYLMLWGEKKKSLPA